MTSKLLLHFSHRITEGTFTLITLLSSFIPAPIICHMSAALVAVNDL